MIDFLFGIAGVVRGLLVGCCGARHCFWPLCSIFALSLLPHCAAEPWGHMLRLASLAVLCGTYCQRAHLLVGDLWRCVVWVGIDIGTCRFLFWVLPFKILAICQIFLIAFMKFSAKSLASGPSGVTTVVLIPAHFM